MTTPVAASRADRLSGARRAARGTTLIELVIVLGIAAIFVGFLGQMLAGAMTAYQSVSPALDSQSQVRYALERIGRELREIAVLTPANATATFNISSPAAGTNGGNTISFTKEDGTAVTIAASGTAVSVTYPAASGTLAQVASSADLVINFYTTASAGNVLATGATAYDAGVLGAVEVRLTATVNGIATTGSTRVEMKNSQ